MAIPTTPAAWILVIGSCGAILALSSTAFQAQQSASQAAPTFRAGTDVVQLDVTVLDKQRRPVRGLNAEDFSVLEDGQTRRIVGFMAVEVPSAPAPGAAWLTNAPLDVVSNERDPGRLITIVMDDAGVGANFSAGRSPQGDPHFDPALGLATRRVGHAIVNQLGPDDIAAVVFTFQGRAQNFTEDRAKLHAAIESFLPKDRPAPPELSPGMKDIGGPPVACRYQNCGIATLRRVAAALPSTPRRKVIALVSQGKLVPTLDLENLTETRDLFRDMQRANITVYGFDPGGLQVGVGGLDASRRLQTFAELTGGRAAIQSNAPWDTVPAILDETRSYYMVGFESVHRDGQFHRIQVRTTRDDVEVHTRSSYFAADPRAKPRTTRGQPTTPLEIALAGALPVRDLALSSAAAVFPVPGRILADVFVVTNVRPSGSVDRAPVRAEIRTVAFDNNWKSRDNMRQTIELVPATDARTASGSTLATLHLPPGRYEVRVAAESGARIGSLYTDVDVPDVNRDDLSLSDIVVGTRSASDSTGLPVRPSVYRSFRREDRVAALLRVYQGGKAPEQAVETTTTIVRDDGATVLHERANISSGRFARRAADVVVDLPTSTLVAGRYLLTIDAAMGARHLTRTIRFMVQ